MRMNASRKRQGLKIPATHARDEALSGAALARKWAGADLFSASLGGCMCAGGFHVPIDPAAVAQDVLTYLEDKYRSSGKAPLAGFAKEAMAGASDFGDWLARLDDAPLAPQDRETLMADLKTTLDTMSGARGFACA